jgi:hypothetical protein
MTRKKTADEKEAALLDAYYREVLRTPAGKAVIWDILSFAGIYQEQFSLGKTDYLLGRKSVGVFILDRLMGIGPDIYPNLIMYHQKSKGFSDDLDEDMDPAE